MDYYTASQFDPDVSVGYLAKRVFQLSVAGLEPMFAEEGVTFTHWLAMVSLHFGRADTCADLARDLMHDKGATTRLIDTLEGKGWVRRERDSGDRRVSRLSLTDEGQRIARQCRDRVVDCWNEWLADWKREDVDQLIGLLQRLRGEMQERVAGEMVA